MSIPRVKKILHYLSNILFTYRFAVATSFIFLSIAEVFFFSSGNDVRTLLIVVFWLMTIIGFRLGSDATFKLTLVLIILLSILFAVARDAIPVEKISVLIYVLLIVGILQQLKEGWRA